MLPEIDNIERYAIFLDLDGTVAELVAHPDSVHVDRSTLRLLEMLSEKVGRALAIVSGREIAVVDRLLRPLVLLSLACTDWSVATPEESSIRGTRPTFRRSFSTLRRRSAMRLAWRSNESRSDSVALSPAPGA